MNKIISIFMAAFSGFCIISAIYTESKWTGYLAPAVMVGFLTYLQFSLSDAVFKTHGLKQWATGIGAAVLFAMAVGGNTLYWLSKSNTDSARLATLERNLKIAEGDKITAQALLSNCNNVVVKGCIKPRSDDLRAKEQAFNNALLAYNAMLSSISKADSFKIASSIIGDIDQKQFLFFRALIGSFFLELGIIYFYVLSCGSKPQDLRDSAQDLEIIKTEFKDNALKKTVDRIINRDQLTEIQQQVLDAYEVYDQQEKILRNGLPSPISQFTVQAFGAGKQGGSHKQNALVALLDLGFITQETFNKQKTEA